MNTPDKKRVQQALENIPDNKSLAWKNSKTKNQYEVTPINTSQTSETYCRDYLVKARIKGKYLTQTARACRFPDGKWHNE
ncbi:17 kDa surface antigen precursor [Candidatus Thiomargarita nelsonii]|uniref:17 kDa surface antigen n=1 Tax=Candidatus Thiomargarita nelsonii TaxID=1003181 RepID=A0A176S5V5_9GAMM|nr:17 kDa surface antigen precursor [Candidatus Thiomargarita nelsonii]